MNSGFIPIKMIFLMTGAERTDRVGESMKILVTGGCGFIGSNFIRYMLNKYDDCQIINLDKLTYAGNLENLKEFHESKGKEAAGYHFIKGDICDVGLIDKILAGSLSERFVPSPVEAIINFAAESHVDRSIEGPALFFKTNISGTQVLLDATKKYSIKRYIQISTDEVYGSLGKTGYFTENTPLAPNSPYSASKAGADLLARSYYQTFKVPVIITRCSNNYGPYQFPEKLIPLMITNALADQPLPIYGDGLYIRDWLHTEDHSRAIDLVLHKGKFGQVYNIGGNCEKTNLEVINTILEYLGKSKTLIKFVKDRPGHDRRYAIDSSKIKKELGWSPRYDFKEGMELTIKWYLENRAWWEKIRSGEYLEYYGRMYGNR
jgi:dTDP-glucose 4,6-dehydratase